MVATLFITLLVFIIVSFLLPLSKHNITDKCITSASLSFIPLTGSFGLTKANPTKGVTGLIFLRLQLYGGLRGGSLCHRLFHLYLFSLAYDFDLTLFCCRAPHYLFSNAVSFHGLCFPARNRVWRLSCHHLATKRVVGVILSIPRTSFLMLRLVMRSCIAFATESLSTSIFSTFTCYLAYPLICYFTSLNQFQERERDVTLEAEHATYVWMHNYPIMFECISF